MQLVEDLLDVSRIIQNKLDLKHGWFYIVKTIEEAQKSVRLAAEAKSVTVSSKLDPAVGLMWGDAKRLQQVVWNLLTNAVKFTPSGGTVELRLSAVGVTDSSSPNYVQITVSDTGKGISKEFLPYVFDRFRQADGSLTRADSGLGLGFGDRPALGGTPRRHCDCGKSRYRQRGDIYGETASQAASESAACR